MTSKHRYLQLMDVESDRLPDPEEKVHRFDARYPADEPRKRILQRRFDLAMRFRFRLRGQTLVD